MMVYVAYYTRKRMAQFTSLREEERNMMYLRSRLGERDTAVAFLSMERFAIIKS